jgi:hypothetical protein
MASKNRKLVRELDEKERMKLEKKKAHEAKKQERIEKAIAREDEKRKALAAKEAAKAAQKPESEDEATETVKATSFDKKRERRAKERAAAKRDKFIGKVVGVCCLVALIGAGAGYAGWNYYTSTVKYLAVDGQNVSKAEFDYHYGHAKEKILTMNFYDSMTYGDYFTQYLGYDASKADSEQTYQNSYTWEDFFKNQAMTEIQTQAGLLKGAAEAGFDYTNGDSDFESFKNDIKDAAAAKGVTEEEYIKSVYGDKANLDSMKDWIMATLKADAYNNYLSDSYNPTDEELKTYYESNKSMYDTVDYKYYTTESEDDTGRTDDAISVTGSNYQTVSALNTQMASWLYDDTRKTGDATVVSNASDNTYTAVMFDSRNAASITDETLVAGCRSEHLNVTLNELTTSVKVDNVRNHVKEIS